MTVHVHVLYDSRSQTQKDWAFFLFQRFWSLLSGRCNWWRWKIWEIQAPEPSSPSSVWIFCNTGMSHLPCGWESAHPAWSGMFILFFYLTRKRCATTKPWLKVSWWWRLSPAKVCFSEKLGKVTPHLSQQKDPTLIDGALVVAAGESGIALQHYA